MELVPEWAPNIHPMIIHFPIAFIVGAIGADLLSLVLRRWDWLRPATVALYVVGGASAVFTYFTGTWAADAVSVPAAAEAALSEHSNLGWWTMWFFCIYALVRLGAHLWSKTRGQVAVQGLLFVLALGGSYLLYETGDHGAKMVYKYGVGAGQVDTTRSVADEPGLTVGASGWQWQPQSTRAWTRRVRWLEGSADTLRTRLDTLDSGGVALAVTPQAPATFVVPDTLGAVRVTAEVNLDQFEGGVALLHHVQGSRSYDYLTVEGSTLRQGRRTDGNRSTFATGTAETEGWRTIRVVGDGTHIRGYVDGEMVVHGHGDAAAPGPVGLRLKGTGTVVLRRLSAAGL